MQEQLPLKIGAMGGPKSMQLAGEIADGDALSVAGTPEDWVQRLRHDVLPTGVDHLLLSFADPYTVRSWSGREIDGVPDLAGQLRLFRDEVIPALT